MKYFAKLIAGGVYRTMSRTFELGIEQEVTKDEFDYFSNVTEKRVTDEDANSRRVNSFHLFACREVENTVEEKVAEEIKDAPDSLRPRRNKEAA